MCAVCAAGANCQAGSRIAASGSPRIIDFAGNLPPCYKNIGEVSPMPELMTLHEKLAISVKSIELKKQGKFEEAERLMKSSPLSPYLAKFIKDYLGLDALLESGWNPAGIWPKRRRNLDQTGLLNNLTHLL
jgi:hypothetical protein